MTGTAEAREETGALGLADWTRAVLTRPGSAPAPPAPPHARLDHTADVLGLGDAARQLLALLHGLWLLPDPPPAPTAARAAALLGIGQGVARPPLAAWELLREVQPHPAGPLALVIDETVADWLEGGNPLPPALGERVDIAQAPEPPPGWPVAATAEFVMAALGHGGEGPVAVDIEGADGTGRRSFARAVAAALDTRPIVADLAGLAVADAQAAARLIDRAAMLTTRPVVWTGVEGLEIPGGRPVFPVQFEILSPGAASMRRQARARRRIGLGALARADREWAWHRLLPSSAAWADRHPAARPATIGDIARAAAAAPADGHAASAALAAEQRARLDPTIRVAPSGFGWNDLVLPDRTLATLRRLVAEIGLAETLWQEPAIARLFPQGRGTFALFSGASGTGKTMAAQVIAAELGTDLYVVDAGAVTSKYVGETSRNLQRVLAQAESTAAVLFFDEADGLFGKRTETRDAHDRYVNAETNVLLQAVESYSSACILATNRRDNIDAAFTRRLRYAVEFPRPDTELRRRLWHRLTGSLAGEAAAEALAPVCDALAAGLDLTGAQIKNAVLSALIAARGAGRAALLAEDLIAGVDQEMMKEGRALSAAERMRLSGHAQS